MGAMCGKTDRKQKPVVVSNGKPSAGPVEKESFVVSDPPTPKKNNVGQNYNFENITSSKMEFGHCDVKGFSDSYTMLFRYLKLGFDEHYILNEGFWRDEVAPKSGFELPALPFVVDGEVKITGDDTVLNYLCYKANHPEMVGRNELDIVKVRMFLGLLRDMKADVIDILLQADNQKEYEKIHMKRIQPRMQKLNQFLDHSDGKECLLGYPTVADFKLYEMVNALIHYNVKGHENYRNLINFVEFFERLFEEQLKKIDEQKIKSAHGSPVKQADILKNRQNLGDRAQTNYDDDFRASQKID